MPNVTDTIANPAKMIDAHAPKVISDESNRCRYKTVRENRAMSISKIDCLNNNECVDKALRFEATPIDATAISAPSAPITFRRLGDPVPARSGHEIIYHREDNRSPGRRGW